MPDRHDPIYQFFRPGHPHPSWGRKIGLYVGGEYYGIYKIFVVQEKGIYSVNDQLDIIHWQSGIRILEDCPSADDNEIQAYFNVALQEMNVYPQDFIDTLNNLPLLNLRLQRVSEL